MPVTLGQLVADRSLGLRVLAGDEALDRPVGWVHVSELADPTPFLEGGELLLTIGLGWRVDTDVRAFVARVVARGLAGLGFGVGLGHDVVPDRLVRAAEAAGLPLLEVAQRTPFIAISKAVSAVLAADAYAEITATNDARRELTAAALKGPHLVVRRLAKLLDGWAIVFDPTATALAVHPAAARERLGDLAPELARMRGRLSSANFDLAGDAVAIQQLGDRGFVAAGRGAPFDRTAQQVLSAAASVLTLTLARAGAVEQAGRRLRTAVLHLLLAGQHELAADVQPLPPQPVEVYVFTGPAARRSRAGAALEARGVWSAESGGRLVALNAGGPLDGLRGGVSQPVEYAHTANAYRQAVLAAESASPGQLVDQYEQAGAALLRLLDPAAARAYAESLLAPVLRHDQTGRGDLVRSLTEWLRRHGQWDPAAARLGVHRHTLRNRINKIAELTGRDLDAPGTRAELWLALQLLDR